MDQGSAGPCFVKWDWEISPFGPLNETGTWNSTSRVPAVETGIGNGFYSVPLMRLGWDYTKSR